MPETILLTGADGFTGRHFAAIAAHAGFRTLALQAKLEQADAIERELAGARVDRVLHLAAISAVTHSNPIEFYEVNLFGTLHLLSALAALVNPPKKIVIASSANVYGNCPHSPISEKTAPAPVNHYAMSKLAMEHMVRRDLDALPIVIARPFNYTGVGHDERFIVPKLVRHFYEKLPVVELGNIDVEREFNDVRTVCQTYLGLLEHSAAGETYNICSGKTHTLREVIETLAGLTGHTIDVRVNPDFVRDNEIKNLCGDPKKLQTCIGTLERPSLEETLKWMLDAGNFGSQH